MFPPHLSALEPESPYPTPPPSPTLQLLALRSRAPARELGFSDFSFPHWHGAVGDERNDDYEPTSSQLTSVTIETNPETDYSVYSDDDASPQLDEGSGFGIGMDTDEEEDLLVDEGSDQPSTEQELDADEEEEEEDQLCDDTEDEDAGVQVLTKMHSSSGAINAKLQQLEPGHVLSNVADPSSISFASMERTVPSSPSTTPAVAAGPAIDPCVRYNVAPSRLAFTSADVLVCLIIDAPAIKARSAGVGNPPHPALRARSAGADDRHPDDRPSFRPSIHSTIAPAIGPPPSLVHPQP